MKLFFFFFDIWKKQYLIQTGFISTKFSLRCTLSLILGLWSFFIFLTASSAAALYVAFCFLSLCPVFGPVFCPVFCPAFCPVFCQLFLFRPVLVCPMQHWIACFASNSTQISWTLLRSISSTQLNSVQLRSYQFKSGQFSSAHLSYFSRLFLCSFDISNLPMHWRAGIFVCFRFIPNNFVQC